MTVRKPARNSKKDATCRQCGKPTAPTGHYGSLTSYLFQARYCNCGKTLVIGQPVEAVPDKASAGSEAQFCARCGLKKIVHERDGSFTSYLMQDVHCRCADDEKFDSVSMSQRFYKLKQENARATANKLVAQNTGKPSALLLKAGTVIAGAYEIIGLIGHGGMGEVYLTRHTTLGKRCAVKVIPPQHLTEVGWQRFQNEARLLANLEHINLVRVTDLGIHDGYLPFYAMDFVEGQTISDRVAQKGPLSVKEAIEIFKQVCDGVDFAHRHQIIHRDLKPSNIMVVSPQSYGKDKSGTDTSEKVLVKILDFGLAKLTQQDRNQQSLTSVGEIFGSPFYMSPEQCAGEKIDNRSDIYSVGCALFEALTERPPFSGSIAEAIMNGHQFGDAPSLESVVGSGKFPAGLEVIVAKLLRKNPTERYQTMAEVKGDLEKLARGEEIEPFYVSRTRTSSVNSSTRLPASAAANAAKSVVSMPAAVTSGSERKLKIIFGTGLLFLLLAGGLAMFLVTRSSESQAQFSRLTAIKGLDSVENSEVISSISRSDSLHEPRADGTADQAKEWGTNLFYQGIVERNGHRFKYWKFPDIGADGIGVMYLLNPWSEVGINMRGDVYMPVSARVGVAPFSFMFSFPQLLRCFSEGNVDGVVFCNMSASNMVKIALALGNLEKVTDINIFSIKDRDKLADAASVQVINRFPSLIRLSTSSLKDGSSLGSIKRLGSLERLRLVGLERNQDKALNGLHGSINMKSLVLDDISINDSLVNDIVSCPNITQLALSDKRNKTIQASLVGKLSALKNLKSLELSPIAYSPQLMAGLARLKTLSDFNCTLAGRWSAEQVRQLQEVAKNSHIRTHSEIIAGPENFHRN